MAHDRVDDRAALARARASPQRRPSGSRARASTARSTAASTASQSPNPISSTLAARRRPRHLARPAADRLHEAQHGLRVHAVRVDHARRPRSGRRRLLGFGSITYSVPGLAALAADVDEHERVVAAHHLVGEVEPAGAEVEHRHAGRQLALARGASRPRRRSRRRRGERCRSRRPGSAAQARSRSSHLLGLEEQEPAALAHHAPARVVVDRHRQVDAVVVVDVDPLERRACRPSSSASCGSPSRPGRSTTFAPRLKTRPSTVRSSLARHVLLRRAHHARAGGSAPPAWRPRRARSSRARGVLRRRSAARSPSLSACTWSSSASSISVSSKRLPRLSGAICGWSGSTIAAPEHGVVLGASRAPATMLTLSPARSSGERNRPPSARSTTCVERSELERRARGRAARRDARSVLCDARTRTRSPSRDSSRAPAERHVERELLRPPGRIQDDAPLDRLVALARSPGGSARSAGQLARRVEAGTRPEVVEGARPSAPRRPAGRRSRTASASRSWSPRACRGRGRSPRRAASRRARRRPRSPASTPHPRAARATPASSEGSPRAAPVARRARRASRRPAARTRRSA